MAINLIIADDEILIGQSIAVMVHEIDAAIEISGIAKDGAEAWKMVQQKKPEIAILDIRMPQMDGLQLLKRITSERYETKVIILTAYRDFEYAQSALKSGAEDYLVKPLDFEKLRQSLQRVQEKCRQEALLRPVVAQHTFHMMLTDSGFRQNQLALWGFHADAKLRIYSILFPKKMDSALYSQFYHELSDALLGMLLQTREEQWAVISPQGNLSSFAVCMDIGRLLEAFNVKPVYIGFSQPHSAEEFETAWREAVSAVKQYFYEPRTPFFEFSGEHANITSGEPNLIRYLEDSHFCEKLNLGLETETEDILESWERAANEKRYAPDAVVRELLEMTRYLKTQSTEDTAALQTMEEKLRELQDAEYYVNSDWLFEYIHTQMSIIAKNRSHAAETDQQRITRKAQAFCEQHYSEPLTLEEVAEEFHLAKSYFCTLFHKETGTAFWEYLTQVRIKNAKRLLEQTEMKANAISAAVGYQNASHFNRIFSEMCGVAPMEYRRRFDAAQQEEKTIRND